MSSGPTGPGRHPPAVLLHRFYSHQPDLNYENPEVADTMVDLVRFWLDLGFDGFRLDAVPYLFQADGTRESTSPRPTPSSAASASSSRRLPGTHPARRGQRLASDVADYFGNGDECHLCFHFP